MTEPTLESVFGHITKQTKSESTSHQQIPVGFRGNVQSIIVVRLRGPKMGKRGPKPRPGKREPNGQLDRSTHAERLNELNYAETRKMKAVVLAQPHRQGADDEWLALAAGRFCRAHGLAKGVYDACDAYLTTERRWMSGWGAPKGFERHNGGSGRGATEAQMNEWRATLNKIEHSVRRIYGFDIYNAMRGLVIENTDFEGNPRAMISALCEMAVVTNFLEKNPHPFGG